MKRKNLLKKVTAMTTTAILVLGCPTFVMAEGTYVDTEKAELQKLISSITETWDAEMAVLEEDAVNANAKIALNVEESAQAILTSVTEVDLSWLQNLVMDMDVSLVDSIEAIDMDLLLNGTSLCTAQMFVDMATQTEYITVPELAPGYLMAALSETGEAVNTENVMDALPDAEVLSTLLDRYGNLILDYLEEGVSIEENVSVEGIGEDCTLYEGILRSEKAVDLATAVLTTAKDDQELKSVIEAAAASDPTMEDAYAQFQTFIDEALADVESSETTEGEYISSKIWVCPDGEVVAREIGFGEGVEVTPLLTWKNPHDGDTSGLLLEMQSEGSSITFVGSSTTADGIMNGQYVLAVDGVSALNVAMENYDVAAAEEGYPAGSFILTIPEDASEEMAMMSIFDLTLNLSGDKETESSEMELVLNCMDSPLASVVISGTTTDETVEIPDLNNLETVYDMASEDDMAAFEAALSFDTIKANAASAGMPEEVIAAIEESLAEAETVEYTE